MVIAVDLDALSDLCVRYRVAEIAVFGSMASGDGNDNSDVDLLYTLMPDSTLGFGIDDFNDELETLFGRRVDLVARRALHPRMRREVLAQARVIYAA